jgi:4-hydroxyphenylpyruvate dioxygenase
MEPKTVSDKDGEVKMSGIHTYGDTVHIFIERKNYTGLFLPGYEKLETGYNPGDTGLRYIDHMVGNVGWNQMNDTVKWYEDVMGFVNFLTFDDKQITTEYSALMSKVMSNGNGRIKFPINEPAEGKKKSQIEEYIDFYEGAGVQHLALATNDIISTVADLKARGVEFLPPPPQAYYDEIPKLLGVHKEEIVMLIRYIVEFCKENINMEMYISKIPHFSRNFILLILYLIILRNFGIFMVTKLKEKKPLLLIKKQ